MRKDIIGGLTVLLADDVPGKLNGRGVQFSGVFRPVQIVGQRAPGQFRPDGQVAAVILRDTICDGVDGLGIPAEGVLFLFVFFVLLILFTFSFYNIIFFSYISNFIDISLFT